MKTKEKKEEQKINQLVSQAEFFGPNGAINLSRQYYLDTCLAGGQKELQGLACLAGSYYEAYDYMWIVAAKFPAVTKFIWTLRALRYRRLAFVFAKTMEYSAGDAEGAENLSAEQLALLANIYLARRKYKQARNYCYAALEKGRLSVSQVADIKSCLQMALIVSGRSGWERESDQVVRDLLVIASLGGDLDSRSRIKVNTSIAFYFKKWGLKIKAAGFLKKALATARINKIKNEEEKIGVILEKLL